MRRRWTFAPKERFTFFMTITRSYALGVELIGRSESASSNTRSTGVVGRIASRGLACLTSKATGRWWMFR